MRWVVLGTLLAWGCGRIGYAPRYDAETGTAAGADAQLDTPGDARRLADGGFDVLADTRSDSGWDVTADSSADAGLDTRGDAVTDAPEDAAADAGRDAGTDTSRDAGTDAAGPPVLIDDGSGVWATTEVLFQSGAGPIATTIPECSNDYAALLGGNLPLAETTSAGNPAPGLHVRTTPIAATSAACTSHVYVFHGTTGIPGRFVCHYELSIAHRADQLCSWTAGVGPTCGPPLTRMVAVVAQGSVRRALGTLTMGSALSGPEWSTSVWTVTRADLDAAIIIADAPAMFGMRFSNSTTSDQMGLGYAVDNTIDSFRVTRFVDANGDGDCRDATPG